MTSASGEAPLRIAQVISVISSSYGGPSAVAVDLNVALADSGIEAVLITSDRRREGGRMSRSERQSVHTTTQGRVMIARSAPPAALQNSWGLIREIWRQANRVDLVHMDGQYLVAHVAAYIAARAHRVPYGIQPHGTLERYQLAQSRGRKRVYEFLIGNRILRGAQYVLFTAQSEADQSRDSVAGQQTRIAPLGTSLMREEAVPEVDDWLAGAARQDVALYLGRLARKKRPELLLRAWARVIHERPASRLVIAGPDDEWTRAELGGLLPPEVAASVHFTGPISRGQATALYRRSGVFVLPSEKENFALTIGEALASGCRVVTTAQVVAGRYVTESGRGEVVASLTDDSIAAALVRQLSIAASDDQSGSMPELGWDRTVAVLRAEAEVARRQRR